MNANHHFIIVHNSQDVRWSFVKKMCVGACAQQAQQSAPTCLVVVRQWWNLPHYSHPGFCILPFSPRKFEGGTAGLCACKHIWMNMCCLFVSSLTRALTTWLCMESSPLLLAHSRIVMKVCCREKTPVPNDRIMLRCSKIL